MANADTSNDRRRLSESRFVASRRAVLLSAATAGLVTLSAKPALAYNGDTMWVSDSSWRSSLAALYIGESDGFAVRELQGDLEIWENGPNGYAVVDSALRVVLESSPDIYVALLRSERRQSLLPWSRRICRGHALSAGRRCDERTIGRDPRPGCLCRGRRSLDPGHGRCPTKQRLAAIADAVQRCAPAGWEYYEARHKLRLHHGIACVPELDWRLWVGGGKHLGAILARSLFVARLAPQRLPLRHEHDFLSELRDVPAKWSFVEHLGA